MKKESPRQRALRLLEPKYKATKPCPSGHLGYRQAQSGECLECNRSRNMATRKAIQDAYKNQKPIK